MREMLRLRQTGLSFMAVLAFSPALFDGTASGGSIGEYNDYTGAPINATFMTGLNDPTGLAIAGSALFVASGSGGSIGEYDLSTGAPINATFMTGLNDPTDLEIAGSTLFVAEPSVVPEPTGIGLLCLGLASVVFHLSIRSTRPDS